MRDNIVVHNLRLNLNHDEELALHRALMSYNRDIYKSKSEYHKKRLYAGIFGPRDCIEDAPEDGEKKTLVSMEELKEILLTFKSEIMKEISEMIISIIMGKLLAHLPSGMGGANAVKTMDEIGESVDDEVEAAACKYFDGI